MRAAAGRREELKAALEALIEPTKQEDGVTRTARISRSATMPRMKWL
jgi:quinol monooxygenase YgiN